MEQLGLQQKPSELKHGQEHINGIKQQHSVVQQQEFKLESNQDQVSRQENLSTLELLLKPEYSSYYVPSELLKKKKQKKQSGGLRM